METHVVNQRECNRGKTFKVDVIFPFLYISISQFIILLVVENEALAAALVCLCKVGLDLSVGPCGVSLEKYSTS